MCLGFEPGAAGWRPPSLTINWSFSQFGRIRLPLQTFERDDLRPMTVQMFAPIDSTKTSSICNTWLWPENTDQRKLKPIYVLTFSWLEKDLKKNALSDLQNLYLNNRLSNNEIFSAQNIRIWESAYSSVNHNVPSILWKSGPRHQCVFIIILI